MPPMKLLDIPAEEGGFYLFAGQSGAGKTCAIASLARNGPMWIGDFDRRWRGILGIKSILGDEILSNISVEHFDIANSFTSLEERLQGFVLMSKQGKLPYKTIVLESANTLDGAFLALADRISGKGTGIATRDLGGVRFYGPSHYLFSSNAFRQLRDNQFLQLKGVTVILSCWVVNAWDKPTTIDDKGRTVRAEYGQNVVVGQKLLLTDKSAETLPGLFDEIYEFGKSESPRPSQPVEHWVRFESKLAKTSNEKLKGHGTVDLTNKLFVDVHNKLLGR